MIPFFRKIRYQLAEDNQFFKYSRYAIGEIVLVVIGILIALYINNWNEQRKEREKFDKLLVEVERELSDNMIWARNTMSDLSVYDSLQLEYFIDSIKFENYSLYFDILHSFWSREKLRTKSIEKITQFNNLSEEQDSIMNDLIDLDRNGRGDLRDYGDYFINLTNDRVEYFQKYDWYNNWLRDDLSADKKFLDFVENDPDYLKMAIRMVYFNSGYANQLGLYEQKALRVQKKIKDYLDSRQIRRSNSLPFNYDPRDYEHYLGLYDSKWCSRETYVHADSIAIKIENGKLFWYGYRPDGPDIRSEIIPINRYRFRSERSLGFYHLEIDDQGDVNGIRYSSGPEFILEVEKIR